MLPKRGQKGFTLVELMVVMAILAILAAVAFPAVSGKGASAAEAQVLSDAMLMNTAISDYYKDQPGAAILTKETVTLTLAVEVADAEQEISNLWPEDYIAAVYAEEFPTSASVLVDVLIKETGDASAQSVDATFLADYNAIDMDALTDGNYIAAPASADEVTAVNSREYNTYLWLLKKTSSAGGAAEDDSRVVAVFKLVSVDILEAAVSGNTDTLTYEQVY